MIDNKKRYIELLRKVSTLLSLPITPSIDIVMEKFGGHRYKSEIARMSEEYRVIINGSFHL